MNRRSFVKNTASFAALYPFLNAASSCHSKTGEGKKIFVMIQLLGGNDGLNMVIPLDNYKKITEARANLFIPENKILPLKGTSVVGLHPSMPGIRDMYDNGQVGFVRGVGYKNPCLSHFRSSDIWLTGADASQVLYTGWMARFLETRYKNYPQGFPNAVNPDPPAIKVGDIGSYLFQGDAMDMSIVIDPGAGFTTPDIDESSSDSDGFAADEVKNIKDILQQTQSYSKVVKNALAGSFEHSKLYPKTGENPLADQLKMVAKLIQGGLQTSVYLVDLKGFDTHDDQVDKKDTTKGIHADLLSKISQAITCFWDDINRMGRQNDVAGMTFSEFGRRIKSNASYGTDHGSSQPIIFFGTKIHQQQIGANPALPEQITTYDNEKLQYDYRSVYSAIMRDWMGASNNDIKKALMNEYPEIRMFG